MPRTKNIVTESFHLLLDHPVQQQPFSNEPHVVFNCNLFRLSRAEYSGLDANAIGHIRASFTSNDNRNHLTELQTRDNFLRQWSGDPGQYHVASFLYGFRKTGPHQMKVNPRGSPIKLCWKNSIHVISPNTTLHQAQFDVVVPQGHTWDGHWARLCIAYILSIVFHFKSAAQVKISWKSGQELNLPLKDVKAYRNKWLRVRGLPEVTNTFIPGLQGVNHSNIRVDFKKKSGQGAGLKIQVNGSDGTKVYFLQPLDNELKKILMGLEPHTIANNLSSNSIRLFDQSNPQQQMKLYIAI